MSSLHFKPDSLVQVWHHSGSCWFRGANASLHFLGIPHHLASTSVDVPSNRVWAAAHFTPHSSTYTHRRGALLGVTAAVSCLQVACACLAPSFVVREHMHSRRGAIRTVNKRLWHHTGQQEEHNWEPRGSLRCTLYTTDTGQYTLSRLVIQPRCHSAMSRHLGQAASH